MRRAEDALLVMELDNPPPSRPSALVYSHLLPNLESFFNLVGKEDRTAVPVLLEGENSLFDEIRKARQPNMHGPVLVNSSSKYCIRVRFSEGAANISPPKA